MPVPKYVVCIAIEVHSNPSTEVLGVEGVAAADARAEYVGGLGIGVLWGVGPGGAGPVGVFAAVGEIGGSDLSKFDAVGGGGKELEVAVYRG